MTPELAGLGWKPMRNRGKQAIRGHFESDLEFVCIFGQDALAPKPGSEHTVFLLQVVDHILLLAVDPASHNEQ